MERAIEIWRLIGPVVGTKGCDTCADGCAFEEIGEGMSLYGCTRCGRIHECDGTGNACPKMRTDDHSMTVCAASKMVLCSYLDQGVDLMESMKSEDKRHTLEHAIEIWRLIRPGVGTKGCDTCEDGRASEEIGEGMSPYGCAFEEIGEGMSLYGCTRCGRIHECDGTGNACPKTQTDDHSMTVCAASKMVLCSGSQFKWCFYEASNRGNESSLGYDEEIEMKEDYFGEAVARKDRYFSEIVGGGGGPSEMGSRSLCGGPQKNPPDAEGKRGTKRKIRHPLLRGMPDGREEYREVSWENLPQNKALAATAQGVIWDMLWDSRKRKKINESLRRRAREGTSNAVLRHTKECLRDGMHPNYFDLTKMYDHHSEKHPSIEVNVPQDAIRSDDLIKRAVLLWKFLRGTPDYRTNGSKYHQKNVYLAFLYMQREGYFVMANRRKVSILPLDPFLDAHLPPRNDVHMLGAENRSYQTRFITKGTRCITSGLQSSRELPRNIASKVNGVDVFGERERERERERENGCASRRDEKTNGILEGEPTKKVSLRE